LCDAQKSHAGFYYPWQFVVAFKDFKGRTGWFLDEAMTNVEIHQRIIPRKDGKSTLQYFDGSTMLSYRFPSKASETVFCLRESKSEMCKEGRHFNEEPPKLPISILAAKPDSDKTHVTAINIQLNPSEDVDFQSYSQYFWSFHKSVDATKAHRELMIHKYFSGENTYNPFADRHHYLYSSSVTKRKLS
jgi:hypothetical protein